MAIHNARRYLALSLIVGAASFAGCIGAEEGLPEEDEFAPEPAAYDQASNPSTELEAAGDEEQAVGAGCPKQRFTIDLTDPEAALTSGGTPSACGVDLYFHPNNGMHGGYIESWRLCNEGGQNYRICTGGYAPVRYWNMSSCGGTIHDYYPQGWSGWAQSGGGCC
jgi:hypothetical protein